MSEETVLVKSARFVTINLAAKMMGLTPAAVRKRVERGMWAEGKQWRRGKDGRVWIDTEGIERWFEATE